MVERKLSRCKRDAFLLKHLSLEGGRAAMAMAARFLLQAE